MPPVRALRINRFTVMAMLQAARARYLGLPEESAYSWGLNRAIWYAAAKRGFSGGGGGGAGQGGGEAKARPGEVFYLGQDFAYRDPNRKAVVFILGGKPQTGDEFRTKIASRFGGERNFRKAWDEATRIVSEAGEELLKSGETFYSEVYKPRRDGLVEKWTKEFAPARKPAGSPRKR